MLTLYNIQWEPTIPPIQFIFAFFIHFSGFHGRCSTSPILNEQESHGIFIFVFNIVMGLRVQSKVKRTKAEPIKAKSMANAKVNKQLAYCLCVFLRIFDWNVRISQWWCWHRHCHRYYCQPVMVIIVSSAHESMRSFWKQLYMKITNRSLSFTFHFTFYPQVHSANASKYIYFR